jgi:oligoribonuclease NrnB/cAMP/cGMP phosphodiesterase (DHH superfamily)
MKSSICFYHAADNDGTLSGYIVTKKLLHRGKAFHRVGVNYGDPIPEPLLSPGTFDQVFIVDFSWKRDEMAKIAKNSHLIWIDHHRTAITDYRDNPFACTTVLDETRAACELTWGFLWPEIETPKIVQAVGAWDIKRWKDISEKEATASHFAIKKVGPACGPDWEYFLDPNNWNSIQETGELISEWVESENKRRSSQAHRVFWEGRFWMVQLGTPVPVETMWEHCPGNYSGLIGVNFIKDSWVISLRRIPGESMDLGLIAKKYGGGGHPAAAGFRMSELPSELFKPV